MHIFIAALHRPVKPTGVCRHAANLARCLVEQPEVTRITLVIGSWQQYYFETAFDLKSEKIKLLPVNIKNSSLVRNFWFLRGLPEMANELNPDVVHLSFPIPFFRAKFNAPVVTTVHDLYPYECPENFGFPQVWFNQLFLRQSIKNSDGLPCVSQVTADKLKLYFPRLKSHQRVEVVYNYVDFSELEINPPEGFTADSQFLLCVAQHRQNKNLDLLIEAYAKLLLTEASHHHYDQLNLIIVGATGPETDKIKSLIAEHNLETKVNLLSAIDDQELGWLYQNCQTFVIPSSTEGFCLPLAEALHFQSSVVCSDIPIFREIGDAQCQYFSLQGDTVDNLTEALTKVLTNKDPKEINQAGMSRFDKYHIAHQYLNLYLQLKY
ncbi:MAG: glycosyltransferase family 1 protein [Cyanobacteria bacterium J06621_8]